MFTREMLKKKTAALCINSKMCAIPHQPRLKEHIIENYQWRRRECAVVNFSEIVSETFYSRY